MSRTKDRFPPPPPLSYPAGWVSHACVPEAKKKKGRKEEESRGTRLLQLLQSPVCNHVTTRQLPVPVYYPPQLHTPKKPPFRCGTSSVPRQTRTPRFARKWRHQRRVVPRTPGKKSTVLVRTERYRRPCEERSRYVSTSREPYKQVRCRCEVDTSNMPRSKRPLHLSIFTALA